MQEGTDRLNYVFVEAQTCFYGISRCFFFFFFFIILYIYALINSKDSRYFNQREIQTHRREKTAILLASRETSSEV